MNDTITLQAGASAFGDGNHPTTMGVLTALEAIDPAAFTPTNACDMGAGSGILSFAMLARFGCAITAVDTAASAVAAIAQNAADNQCAERITAIRADGFAHPTIAAHAPYDLITMNILAEPLLRLMADANHHLAPGGLLILSGILRWQEPQIIAACESLMLERTFRVIIGDWVTLAWQKG